MSGLLPPPRQCRACRLRTAQRPALRHRNVREVCPGLVAKHRVVKRCGGAFEAAVRAMQAAKEAGGNPYPHKFVVSHTIPEFIAAFGDIANGDKQTDVTASVAGAPI